MSDARTINVANAAVALLNSGPAQAAFTPFTFTAVRAYRPIYDLKAQKAGLKITVVHKANAQKPNDRLTVRGDVAIDVAVQNFVNNDAESDALTLLVEQIQQSLEKGLVLADGPYRQANWISTECDPIFFPDHMARFSVFTSVSTLTFVTRRPR